jgi:hypothetical protein
MDAFTLPDGTITADAGSAAEQWAAAFYMAKDVIAEICPVPEALIKGIPVRNLDEILLGCDGILSIGEK